MIAFSYISRLIQLFMFPSEENIQVSTFKNVDIYL